MAYKYMHLINGEPAQYVKDEQILCATLGSGDVRLAHSLQQIRKEQRASTRWRKEHGMPVGDVVYGYARLLID